MSEIGPPFDDPETFWPLVKKARENANMGPVQFAREMGTTHQRLGRLENGNEGSSRQWTPAARRNFAIAVAEVLKCPRSALGLPPLPGAAETASVQEKLNDLELEQGELHEGLDGVRVDLERVLRRLERVERGMGATGS